MFMAILDQDKNPGLRHNLSKNSIFERIEINIVFIIALSTDGLNKVFMAISQTSTAISGRDRNRGQDTMMYSSQSVPRGHLFAITTGSSI